MSRAADIEPPLYEEPNPTRRLLAKIFGMDLRSLAAVRVAVAVSLLWDLYQRCRFLDTWYTDTGVLPRASKMITHSTGGREYWWSLHMAGGEPFFQWLLMGVAAWFALMLLIGYRTRVAAWASLILLISVQYRNTMISQGGDVLLRACLFWLCWLPLGAQWSVDNALRDHRDEPWPVRIVTFASVAMLFQLIIVYIFSAAHKTHAAWMGQYTAVWMALHNDHFAARLGHWLRMYPDVCYYLTFATIYWEWIGPWLILSPGWHDKVRGFCVLSFLGFHFGLSLTMSLGMFPWVAMALWLCVLPSGFWDGAMRWWRPPEDSPYTLRVQEHSLRNALLWRAFFGLQRRVPIEVGPPDPPAGAIRELARRSPIFGPLGPALGALLVLPLPLVALWRSPRVAEHRWNVLGYIPLFRNPSRIVLGQSLLAATIVFGCFAYTVLWNFRTRDYEYVEATLLPRELNPFGRATGLNQNWGLFAPYPLRDGGWFILRGTLGNDREVDLWTLVDGRFSSMSDEQLYRGPQPDFPLTLKQRPKIWSEAYPNEDWQKYFVNIWWKKNARHRPLLIGWLRHAWRERINETQGISLDELKSRQERRRNVVDKIDEADSLRDRHRARIVRYDAELAELAKTEKSRALTQKEAAERSRLTERRALSHRRITDAERIRSGFATERKALTKEIDKMMERRGKRDLVKIEILYMHQVTPKSPFEMVKDEKTGKWRERWYTDPVTGKKYRNRMYRVLSPQHDPTAGESAHEVNLWTWTDPRK